jgi:RNA 3'-terminal phosphate cyclase (ATP)
MSSASTTSTFNSRDRVPVEQMEKMPVDHVIDGSYLEGGGQVMRNSVALAALLNRSVRIERIRAGRKKPGLHAQHLCGLELVTEIRAARLFGGRVESNVVVFDQTQRRAGDAERTEFHVDVKTAGSVCLLVQISLPVLLFANAPTSVTMIGGTNATGAPQIDYFTLVLIPTLRKLAAVDFAVDIVRRGYFPRGNGEAVLRTTPVDRRRGIQPIVLTERGHVTEIYIRSYTAGSLPQKLAAQMSNVIQQRVAAYLAQREPTTASAIKFTVENVHETQCVGSGTGTIVLATTSTGCLIAASGVVERNQRADDCATVAADKLIEELTPESCTDEYLQDQLIIFMALANGRSSMRTGPLSLHTRTALHFVSLLTNAKFTVTAESEQRNHEDQPMQNLIECEGIAFGVEKQQQ